ncbi:Uncharacterised protein [Mycobacteroides abscessus subsp. abscessus]|nr:Uncharacterised protein [Mycobacteroides abscessus subsp. abscessus]
MPAPASIEMLSGSLNTISAGVTATSAMALPSMVSASTRSPGRTCAPSGASRTTPATSPPTTNGSSGFIW